MVAHHFKHVKSNDERPTPGFIPLSAAVLGTAAFNTTTLNDTGMDVRNLFYVVQDAVKFLHKQADPALGGGRRRAARPPDVPT